MSRRPNSNRARFGAEVRHSCVRRAQIHEHLQRMGLIIPSFEISFPISLEGPSQVPICVKLGKSWSSDPPAGVKQSVELFSLDLEHSGLKIPDEIDAARRDGTRKENLSWIYVFKAAVRSFDPTFELRAQAPQHRDCGLQIDRVVQWKHRDLRSGGRPERA
jgi:hypothetical protein